ncbi:hypothetical protein L596_006583 [Steinernema carpocapsae]|uniref:Uncharacterized protein n=1 Tax=Steinernema carpocapsae TaxID=34508 RepID=A0A4U8V2I1_STECR|nr:hypothetical protein L596_006583 [Steinernema carpocapsae]
MSSFQGAQQNKRARDRAATREAAEAEAAEAKADAKAEAEAEAAREAREAELAASRKERRNARDRALRADPAVRKAQAEARRALGFSENYLDSVQQTIAHGRMPEFKLIKAILRKTEREENIDKFQFDEERLGPVEHFHFLY